MEMRILKQILSITDETIYDLPGKNAKPLSVQEQNGNLVLYFLSDFTENELVGGESFTPTKILIAGTGHNRLDIADANYIGTAVMPYGLVFHCFYVMERE